MVVWRCVGGSWGLARASHTRLSVGFLVREGGAGKVDTRPARAKRDAKIVARAFATQKPTKRTWVPPKSVGVWAGLGRLGTWEVGRLGSSQSHMVVVWQFLGGWTARTSSRGAQLAGVPGEPLCCPTHFCVWGFTCL